MPYGRRINALAGCVQLYRPIGYLATFSYLEHVSGHFRRDEVALVRALGALSSSRELWLVELSAYADQRREAKRLGRRSPQATELSPNSPACWYGDPRNAAIFALRFLLRKRGRTAMADAHVVRLASACVEAGGVLGPAEGEQLMRLRSYFERIREASGWPDIDWPNWNRANDSLRILHHITCASASEGAFFILPSANGHTS
jgi:hypothetical protein